ncbi:HAD-IIB family hydrolase [Leifsonia sp. A12D58]|uniref:HAD-IIB family hydrolase n=1 Tax=Leifsonia sp. A12D58 TaxID=3397674 RepID=UPI0039E1476F
MKAPVLVATDLDGTLVPNASMSVPAFTARVLRRLDDAGVPVVFVTGRPLRWMSPFWPHVGKHGLAIVSNGAITFDAHAQRVISITGIDAEPGLELSRSIAAAIPGASFAIECTDGIRLDPNYPELGTSRGSVRRGALAAIWDQPAAKLLVRHSAADADIFQARVAAVVGDRATVTWSVPGLAEISAAGVSKASALARLCERRGIAARDVIAFGDMPNDIAMLGWAGTAYAVANAHESVRAIAHDVVLCCKEEGVAHALDRLVPVEL